jgi:hypothetical protein
MENRSTRDLFETADGMRHWWNDDNPESEQRIQYETLSMHGRSVAHDVYVADLEAIVAELYQRYERGEIIGGQLA